MMQPSQRSCVLACATFCLGTAAALNWSTSAAQAQTVTPDASASAAPAKPTGKTKSLGKVGAAPAAAARDPDRAKRAYEAGVTAYQAGRHDEAVNQLNTAVTAGGLVGPAMARALYYRGAAFHAKGMSGQAISDLTSALWFKGGLDDSERAQATQIRGDAYRAAGLDPKGNTAVAAAASTPTTTASSASGGSWAASQVASGADTPRLSAAPGDTQPSTDTTPGIDLGAVFGNIFGNSGSSAKPVETSALPRETSAVAPAQTPASNAALPAVAASSSGNSSAVTEVLPWGAVAVRAAPISPAQSTKSTTVKAPAQKAEPKPKPARQATAVRAETATATAASTTSNGTYRIQIGTAKSQAEANALVGKIKGNAALAGADVTVDPMAFGGTTFYRVRVGPYATANDTRAPCSALKANGLDCLVTTQ